MGCARDAGPQRAMRAFAVVLCFGFFCLAGAARAQSLEERANRGLIEISAGPTAAADLKMMEEVASVLDTRGMHRVLAVVGKGPLQNLMDLVALRGIDLALVPLDVLDHARERKLFPKVETLSYVAKLYQAEFHLLARADIGSVGDLEGKKVNLGSLDDGSAIAGARVFDRLKIKIEATRYDAAAAVEKLQSGEIAALFYVSAKPAPLFKGLGPVRNVKFLSIPLDCNFAGCAFSQLTSVDYPDLVTDPVPTLSVAMVMAVAPLARDSERFGNVASFTNAFFARMSDLLTAPHSPKWREVDVAAEIAGWRRFEPAETWVRQNAAARTAVNERQLRDIFTRFLDERSRSAGSIPLTSEQKDQLFEQFRSWEHGQVQTGSSTPR